MTAEAKNLSQWSGASVVHRIDNGGPRRKWNRPRGVHFSCLFPGVLTNNPTAGKKRLGRSVSRLAQPEREGQISGFKPAMNLICFRGSSRKSSGAAFSRATPQQPAEPLHFDLVQVDNALALAHGARRALRHFRRYAFRRPSAATTSDGPQSSTSAGPASIGFAEKRANSR
jgi:hypothetical protein